MSVREDNSWFKLELKLHNVQDTWNNIVDEEGTSALVDNLTGCGEKQQCKFSCDGSYGRNIYQGTWITVIPQIVSQQDNWYCGNIPLPNTMASYGSANADG